MCGSGYSRGQFFITSSLEKDYILTISRLLEYNVGMDSREQDPSPAALVSESFIFVVLESQYETIKASKV